MLAQRRPTMISWLLCTLNGGLPLFDTCQLPPVFHVSNYLGRVVHTSDPSFTYPVRFCYRFVKCNKCVRGDLNANFTLQSLHKAVGPARVRISRWTRQGCRSQAMEFTQTRQQYTSVGPRASDRLFIRPKYMKLVRPSAVEFKQKNRAMVGGGVHSR